MGLSGPRETSLARCAVALVGVALLLSSAHPSWAKQVAFPYADDLRHFSICALEIGGPPGTPTAGPAVAMLLAGPPPVPGNWRLTNPLGGAVGLSPATIEKLGECDLVVVDGASLELLAGGGPIPPGIQDALLQIADSGAVVWIDYDPTAGPWTADPAPRLAPFAATAAPSPGVAVDLTHPLLSTPLRLTPADILAVGSGGTVAYGDPRALSPVIASGVWAGEYGSGGLIVSASGVMAGIVAGVPGALKLAVNALEWSNRWTQEGADPRQSGEINLTVEPPLMARWQFPGVSVGPPVPPFGAAFRLPVAVARGLVFVCNPPDLYALDLDPAQDLDADGSADEGIPDYGAAGTPYDMIWASGALPAPATYSGLCTATVGGVPVVLATVVGGTPASATLSCFNALTGALAWAVDAGAGFYPGAAPVWVSPPVAHKGYAYFLVQYPGPPDYTVAVAVHLATGTLAWRYPDPAFELALPGSPVPALLPPVVNPADIAAGLPVSGPTPVVASLAHVPDGAGTGTSRALDTVLVFGTFGSFGAVGTPPHGTQIALAPTPPPYDADGGGPLPPTAPNFDPPSPVFPTGMPYYAIETTSGAPVDPPTALQDDRATLIPGPAMDVMGNAVTFADAWARSYFVNILAPTAPPPPPEGGVPPPPAIDVQGWREGRNVLVSVVGAAGQTETCLLRGPVLWKYDYPAGEGAGRRATADFEKVMAPTDTQGYPVPLGASAYYHDGENRAVALRWAAGLGSPTPANALAAAGAENTAYILGNAGGFVAPGVPGFMDLVGLKIDAEMKIRLASPPDTGSVSVTLLPSPPGGLIPPAAYDVDEADAEIIFDPAQSAWLGGLWVSVAYATGGTATTETHVLPDVRRWEHAPGIVKLRYSLPLVAPPTPIQVYLADIAPSAATLVTGYTMFTNGILNFAGATCPAVGSVLGREVEINYWGYSEADGGAVVVGESYTPTPWAGTFPPERHLVPGPIGPTWSAPCVTGDAIHVGDFDSGVGLGSVGVFTVHSARWSKSTNAVYGHDAMPAVSSPLVTMAVNAGLAASATPRRPVDVLANQLSIPLSPDLSAGPAGRPARLYYPPLMDGTVLVGATAASPPAPSAGYVSALAPPRTMIADATRIVEAKGPEVEWEATGTVGRLPGRSALQFRPFTRPAKASVLDAERNIWVLTTAGGAPDFRDVCAQSASNILVVDTGNNRVVEIDRDGDLVWPGTPVFDAGGALLYHEELDLGLDSPSDACRWVAGGVYHTVIADTGNWRLLDVATSVSGTTLGQTHVMTEVSPPYVLLDPDPMDNDPTPTRMNKVGYSQVIPLFNTTTGASIGYLCAAVNLHRFIVINTTGVGAPVNPVGAPFAYVQWLYDRNLDGTTDDPLVFEDIKQVSVYPRPQAPNARGIWPYGGPIFITVTASRYVNPPPGPFATAWDGTLERAGCFEFNALAPALGEPAWHFTSRDYLYDGGAGPRALTWLTDGTGTAVPKEFVPVSCQPLSDGSHVICNAAAQRANVTLANFPGGDTNLSQVLRVVTNYALADNAAGLHLLDHRHLIPDARLRPWTQPLSQPAYAERY